MKILDKIASVFNQKQQKQVEELLSKMINEGKIPWKDTYYDILKNRMPDIIDGIKLDRVPGKSNVNINKINEQLENIEISTVSLAAESEEINNTISRHEM